MCSAFFHVLLVAFSVRMSTEHVFPINIPLKKKRPSIFLEKNQHNFPAVQRVSETWNARFPLSPQFNSIMTWTSIRYWKVIIINSSFINGVWILKTFDRLCKMERKRSDGRIKILKIDEGYNLNAYYGHNNKGQTKNQITFSLW